MRIIFHENVKVPTGFIQVLQKYGHKTYLWKEKTPAFDIFDLYEPDIVVINEVDKSNTLDKCILETGGEVSIFYADSFYFPAFPNIEFPCLPDTIGMKLDIVYFGEYDPILRDLCLPDSNRNFKIFNSVQLQVPQEIGRVSLEEIYNLIDNKITLIDIESKSDPEFTWLCLGKGAVVISNNERIPTPAQFNSKVELMEMIEQEKSYNVGKVETYRDRAISFFKKLKMPEEVQKIA